MRHQRGRPSPSPAWTLPITERLTRAIRTLVIVETLLFLFYVFVPEVHRAFESHLALADLFWEGEIWQPVTALFVHVGPGATVGFLLNMVGLWFVGAPVERAVGTRRMLAVFATAGLAANLALALASRLFSMSLMFDGCGFAVTALFVVFARVAATQPLLGALYIRAGTLVAILIGFSLLTFVARAQWPFVIGELVAVAVGLAFSPGGLGPLLRLRRKPKSRRFAVIAGGGRRPGYLN